MIDVTMAAEFYSAIARFSSFWNPPAFFRRRYNFSGPSKCAALA
ncbi:MAG: hypothetical protein JWO89_1959 [Verrucomicrobiaceae bacterium]|nr:hypothetical protein [Verrucomicrobiaceae bacterium]MDB6116502.1 hypothetical protein [Verrucomicrobiaceae bacterium]